MNGEPTYSVRTHRAQILASILAFLTFATAFVAFVPVARCPFCPYVSPQAPGRLGCPECDDTQRVSLYQRWMIQRRLR